MSAEVWLYGSRARGDFDDKSDTDILFVADDVGQPLPEVRLPYPNVSVSRYSWQELELMVGYGSLFAHHLSAEGVCLWSGTDGRLAGLLSSVPPFRQGKRDLIGFRRCYADARHSLRNAGWPDLEFEILATMARHAAILCSYCLGEASFGRETPFSVIEDLLKPVPNGRARRAGTLATTYRYRLASPNEGKVLTPEASRWLADIEWLLHETEGAVERHDSALLAAA